jgi:hypothetical protein
MIWKIVTRGRINTAKNPREPATLEAAAIQDDVC